MSWCHLKPRLPSADFTLSFEWWNLTSGPTTSAARSVITGSIMKSQKAGCLILWAGDPMKAWGFDAMPFFEDEHAVGLGNRAACFDGFHHCGAKPLDPCE